MLKLCCSDLVRLHPSRALKIGLYQSLSFYESSIQHLPLRLFPSLKLLQNPDLLLQRLQPCIRRTIHLRLIIAQLRVEIFAVGCSAHGGVEDRLDNERVVRLERVAVGVAEGDGEFLGRVGDIVADCLGGEIKTPV